MPASIGVPVVDARSEPRQLETGHPPPRASLRRESPVGGREAPNPLVRAIRLCYSHPRLRFAVVAELVDALA